MSRIRDFNTLASMIDRGGLMGDVNGKLTEVVEKLSTLSAEQPKKKIKGTVSLTIGIEVQNGIATIVGEASAKMPKDDPRSTLLWLTSDGELTNEHPTQMDMFKPREVRETADA